MEEGKQFSATKVKEEGVDTLPSGMLFQLGRCSERWEGGRMRKMQKISQDVKIS